MKRRRHLCTYGGMNAGHVVEELTITGETQTHEDAALQEEIEQLTAQLRAAIGQAQELAGSAMDGGR